MPQAIPAFLASLGNAILGAAVSAGLSYSTAFFIVSVGAKLAGLALLNTIYNKFFVPDVGKSAQSFTVTVRGTIEHCRITYGETLTSGLIWYFNTAGTHNQSLYHGIVLASHEIEDVTDIWIDDNVLPEASIDWAGDGAVDSGDFRGDTGENKVVYFQKFLGTAGQAVSNSLNNAFGEINTTHKGGHTAWLMTRFDYFEEQAQVWSAGIPNNIKALTKGKKVYDPRSDDTQSFGTGPHRLASSLTWEYNNNPALCWADYMIDSRLGFGESSARIDYGYVASAAEICDEILFTPVGTSKKFTCDGHLSTGDTYETNIKRILSSMNGTAALLNGTWRVRAWGFSTPTLQFSDDDLRDDIQIKLQLDEDEKYNTVRGVFVDKDRLWKSSEFYDFTSSEYVSRDNDKVLYKDISLAMTKDVFMAQRLAAGVLEQSDLEKTVLMPTNYKTLPVEIGGTLMLSNTKMGWTDKVFRVERYKFQDMGGIDLILREDAEAAYADVTTADYAVQSNGIYTPANPGVPPPTGLAASSLDLGIRVDWANPAARLYDKTNVYASPSNQWASATLVGASYADFMELSYAVTTVRWFWARSVNYLGLESAREPDSDTSTITATATGPTDGADGATAVLDSRDWTSPIADSMGAWDFNLGDNAESSMHKDVAGPFGTYPHVMRFVGDGATNPGWYANYTGTFPYDSDKSYVAFVWVRVVGAALSNGLYLGWNLTGGGSEVVNAAGGAASSNPYFISNAGASMTLDKWYLAAGIIYADSSVSSDPGYSGLFDPDDGTKHQDGNDYEWNGQALTEAYMRLGFFDSAAPPIDATDGYEFTKPVMYLIDGTEPSIEQVLAGGSGQSSHLSTIYLRSSSAPSTPTGGSYNFGTNVLTAPSGGWTEAIPAIDADPLYASTTTWRITGFSATDSSTTWSTPVKIDNGGVTIGDLEPDGDFHNSDTPGPVSTLYKVDNDGDWYRDIGAGYSSQGTWIGNGANTDYEVRFDMVSGSSPTGVTFGTWLICSTDRILTLTRPTTSGTTEGNLTTRFRRISDNLELGTQAIRMRATIL